MIRKSLRVALVLSCLSVLGAPVRADSDPNRHLIEELGSGQYEHREAAALALEASGAQALPALRIACSNKDPEVRRRAERLVAQIEKRLETAAVLKPTLVRLSYHDVPLTDAVADLARRSGTAIQLGRGVDGADSLKVNLDTGDVTFWQAMDLLCQEAHLLDRVTLPSDEVSGQPGEFRTLPPDNSYNRVSTGSAIGRVLLMAGNGQSLPTSYAGAVRVRAVPPAEANSGWRAPKTQAVVNLQVTPQPNMAWQGVLDVCVEKALDDQGQQLDVVPGNPDRLQIVQTRRGRVLIGGAGGVRVSNMGTPARSTGGGVQFPVYLIRKEKPSNKLVDLRGTVIAQVLTAPRPLISVPEVSKQIGTTFRAPDGESVKVLAFTRQQGDPDPTGAQPEERFLGLAGNRDRFPAEVKLRLHVEEPIGGLARNPRVFIRGNNQIFARNMPMMRIDGQRSLLSAPDRDLMLQDAQGTPLTMTGRSYDNVGVNNGGMLSVDLVLTYEGAAVPERFVYVGQRSISIEIPFSLKNVPLP